MALQLPASVFAWLFVPGYFENALTVSFFTYDLHTGRSSEAVQIVVQHVEEANEPNDDQQASVPLKDVYDSFLELLGHGIGDCCGDSGSATTVVQESSRREACPADGYDAGTATPPWRKRSSSANRVPLYKRRRSNSGHAGDGRRISAHKAKYLERQVHKLSEKLASLEALLQSSGQNEVSSVQGTNLSSARTWTRWEEPWWFGGCFTPGSSWGQYSVPRNTYGPRWLHHRNGLSGWQQLSYPAWTRPFPRVTTWPAHQGGYAGYPYLRW